MRCHPARWLWGLIPVAMLSWLAVQLERSSIQSDLEGRSIAVLAAQGHDWAVVAFDGRDGLVAGQPDRDQQRDEAVALVRGVWGVRVVRTRDDAAKMTAPRTPADVPIAPALEPSLPDELLGDQSPDALVGDLAPGNTEEVPAAQTSASMATMRAEPVRAASAHVGEALRVGRELGATALPTIRSREVVVPAAVASASLTSPAADAVAASPAGPEIASRSLDLPARKPPPPIAATTIARHDSSASIRSGTDVGPAPPAAVEVPDRNPARAARPSVDAATASESIAVPPASPGAPTASPTLAAPPERKPPVSPPAVVAAAATHPSKPASDPGVGTPAPRFETSALPLGNIASADGCLGDVRGAAQRVEVHFARGDARLDTPGKTLIDGLVAALNACPEAVIRIAGHADATGKTRHNQVLSRRRARGVASYMADKGIDAGRLVAIGYGDKRPVAPNDTQANRARNRRIELNVTARAEPLPPMPIRKQGTRNGLSHR